jgi:hypothetical protein
MLGAITPVGSVDSTSKDGGQKMKRKLGELMKYSIALGLATLLAGCAGVQTAFAPAIPARAEALPGNAVSVGQARAYQSVQNADLVGASAGLRGSEAAPIFLSVQNRDLMPASAAPAPFFGSVQNSDIVASMEGTSSSASLPLFGSVQNSDQFPVR